MPFKFKVGQRIQVDLDLVDRYYNTFPSEWSVPPTSSRYGVISDTEDRTFGDPKPFLCYRVNFDDPALTRLFHGYIVKEEIIIPATSLLNKLKD